MTRSDASPLAASIGLFLSSASAERTLRLFTPTFQPSLSTLITPDHIPTLLLASLNDTRKAALIQVELQNMTVVLP